MQLGSRVMPSYFTILYIIEINTISASGRLPLVSQCPDTGPTFWIRHHKTGRPLCVGAKIKINLIINKYLSVTQWLCSIM